MKAKSTLLKSIFMLLAIQATLCATSSNVNAATLKVEKTTLYNMTNFAFASITGQPQSVTTCAGNTAQFSITATTIGVAIYSWQKDGLTVVNGDNISGANTDTLTITGVTAGNAGEYHCVILDLSGSQSSENAYLNTEITSASGNTSTCLNSAVALTIEAQGNNTQYQWYSNGSTNSTTGGTAIAGATLASYSPAVNAEGTTYYYAVAYPAGYECAQDTTGAIAVTVSASAAGTTSGNQIVCPNGTTSVSLTNYSGTIQWQQSVDGTSNWASVTGGSGANGATYTTPALTATTYYRAAVGSFTCGTVYSNPVAVSVSNTFVWTGSINTNWNEEYNWSCNVVPTSNEDVVIPDSAGNQPTITGITGHAKSIDVQDGATLTIAPGATLRVVNDINVDSDATFIVQNNGAIVQDTDASNDGVITLYKNSNPLYRLDYTMWSSPVSGQQLLAFSPETNATRFYEYKYGQDPVSNQYVEQYFGVNAATTNFEGGKGYLIRMPNTNTAAGYNAGTASMVYEGAFTGELHNGPVSINATAGSHYTAVGNPYPSPISVTDFYNENAGILDASSAIYLWRKRNDASATSYATLTLAGYTANAATGGGSEQENYYTGNNEDWVLSQGQGFIVKPKEDPDNNNIIFKNSMRREAVTSGSQGFFKSAQQPVASRLWLNLTGNGDTFSQAAIAYMDNATTGLDYGYDGTQFTDGGISFYSVAEETNLAIQARPAFEAADVVPMGYTTTNAGEYTITLDHTDGIFAGNQEIYIKDNVAGLTHNIKNGAYTFTTEAGTFTNRFDVVYTTNALSTNTPEFNSNNVIVYKEGAGINIASGTANITDVTVYDIRGRKLYGSSNINALQTTINGLQAQQEVVIVEVATVKGKVSKKVIL